MITSPRLLALVLAGLCSPLLHAAPPATTAAGGNAPLLAQDFNHPTELTYNFPPLPGEKWAGPIDNSVSVNSNDGQAKILHSEGLGAGKTGGLYLEVVKPASNFMQVNYDRVTIFTGDPAGLTLAQLRALQLRFDAKIPAGAKLEVYAMLIVPKEWKQRAWAGRLPLGQIAGNGEFQTYTLSAEQATPAATEALLRLAQDHGLNHSARELKLTLAFKLAPLAAWPAGSGLQLDNVALLQTDAK